MKPPPRLLDDAEVAPELRRDLERTASAPSHYDIAAGLVMLEGAIASAATSAAGGAHVGQSMARAANAGTALQNAAAGKSAGLLGAVGTKLAGVVTGVVLAAAGVTAVHWQTRRAAPAPAALVAAPQATSLDAAPRVAEAAAPAQVAEPAHTKSEPAQPAQPSLRPTLEQQAAREPNVHGVVARHRQPGLTASSDALRREVEQLGAIKAALEQEPAEAYRLATAGHREFSHGVMRQEREALAILALARMQRNAEAERRARAFLARYPHSPMRERVERVLAAEGE